MEFASIKQCVRECPELVGLDEHSLAVLFWRGEELQVPVGEIIYAENTLLDDTFCILLSGTVAVEKDGNQLGQITGPQIFGEMAYFTNSHARTATVRGGESSSILKIQLRQQELTTPAFAMLWKYLGREAWDRFVSSSQT